MAHIPTLYAECSFQFSCIGVTDPIVTTIGCKGEATMTASVIAGLVLTAWTSSGSPSAPFNSSNMSNQYTLQRVDCTRMTASGPEVGSSGSGGTGGSAVSRPPPNVAFLVNKVTARGGRKGRGRMFLPAGMIPEGEIDEAGRLQTATMTAQQPKLDKALANMVAALVTPVLLHSGELDTPDVITGLVLQNLIGSQRRRLR